MLGQPRRVFEYARNLQTLNDWVSISAFCLGALDADLRLQLRDVHGGLARAGAGRTRGRSRGLEWQVASPPPPDNFARIPVVLSGPVRVRRPDALPVADLNPPAGVIAGALAGAGAGAPRRAPGAEA